MFIDALRIYDFVSASPVDFINKGTIEIDLDNINGTIWGLSIDAGEAETGTLKNYGTIISRQKYQSKLEESNNTSSSLRFINTGFTNEKGVA